MPKTLEGEAPPGAAAETPAPRPRDGDVPPPPAGAHRRPAFAELELPDIWARLRKLALRQLDRVVALEPKVLRDESPKPVHDLRVASRRLQALLDSLYAAPRPPEVRKLRRRLRQARQALGDLRNCDVLMGRTERALRRQRTAHREAWQAGHDHIEKLRRKTAARAHRKLTKLNLGDLYVRLREELAGRTAPEPAAPVAPARVIAFPDDRGAPEPQPAPSASLALAARFAEGLGELWQDFEARGAEARRDRGALHAFRISAKRLRYHIEVAAELDVPGSADALGWLRALQARLGDWHDDEVLGGILLDMVARRAFLEAKLPLAMEVEKLVLSLRRAKARSCERFLRDAFKSPERRRTADWVAQRAGARDVPAG